MENLVLKAGYAYETVSDVGAIDHADGDARSVGGRIDLVLAPVAGLVSASPKLLRLARTRRKVLPQRLCRVVWIVDLQRRERPGHGGSPHRTHYAERVGSAHPCQFVGLPCV